MVGLGGRRLEVLARIRTPIVMTRDRYSDIRIFLTLLRCLCKEFSGAIIFKPDIACAIIFSCMVLHNYGIERNFPITVDSFIIDNLRDSATDEPLLTSATSDKKLTGAGFLFRQSLLEKQFSKRKRSVHCPV